MVSFLKQIHSISDLVILSWFILDLGSSLRFEIPDDLQELLEWFLLEDDRDVRGIYGPNFVIFGVHLIGFWHFSLGFRIAVSDYLTWRRSIRHPSPETPHQCVRLLVGVSDFLSECPTSFQRPIVGLSTPGQSLRPPSPETPCRILRPCVGLNDPEAIQSVLFDFRFAFECSKSLLGLTYH